MNPLLEVILKNGLLLDAAGAIGIGLFGLAAVRLARQQQSWGGNMMAVGAISLLIARLYLVMSPFMVNDDVLHSIGPVGVSLTIGVPPLLLTFGLASIVWGLWGHERWMRATSR